LGSGDDALSPPSIEEGAEEQPVIEADPLTLPQRTVLRAFTLGDATLRPVDRPAVAARLVLETIFHWAVDGHWDPRPTQVINEDSAERALVDFIVAALAQPVAPGRTAGARAKQQRRPR
jgi:hypothetical protein